MDDAQHSVHEFRAANVREALAEIRRTLGPDAIILEQESEHGAVLVRACLELPPPATPQPHSDAPQTTSAPAMPSFQFAQTPIALLRGRYRFIGTAGTGKTSFIIKIAAEWVLHNPPEGLVIVTTDNERLAGTESLHLTGELLGVKVIETTETQVESTLRKHDHQLALIDTPALTLPNVALHPAGAHDILVISALHRDEHLIRQKTCLAGLPLTGICVSHLDQFETADPNAWALLKAWGLPLYWVGVGSAIPHGIEMACDETMAHSASRRQRSAVELTV